MRCGLNAQWIARFPVQPVTGITAAESTRSGLHSQFVQAVPTGQEGGVRGSGRPVGGHRATGAAAGQQVLQGPAGSGHSGRYTVANGCEKGPD